MKKKLLFLSVVLLSLFANAQTTDIPIETSKVKTTYEEYNFLTKVYPNDDNKRMLDGYEFKPFFEKTIDKYNFNLKFFVEKETQNVKAIFIVATKMKKKEDKKRYLAIPLNNEKLFKVYKDSETSIGLSMYSAYAALISEIFLKLLDNEYNVKK